MSWDIFVQDVPKEARTIDDIPADFRPGSLLPRRKIVEVFREVAPLTDFSDPTFWRIDFPEFSVEVSIGEEDPSQGFALHVRGGGEAAGFVHEILERLGVRALDPSAEGGIFDLEASRAGFLRWCAYRDGLVGAKDGNDE